MTDWHIETLTALGLTVREHERINCAGMRVYRNGGRRVDYESVVLLERNLTTVSSRPPAPVELPGLWDDAGAAAGEPEH